MFLQNDVEETGLALGVPVGKLPGLGESFARASIYSSYVNALMQYNDEYVAFRFVIHRYIPLFLEVCPRSFPNQMRDLRILRDQPFRH